MRKGDEEALTHKDRSLIYNYISAHPGSSFGSIQDIVDMNASTLKYHLQYLERAGLVSSVKEGRRRCYYRNDGVRSTTSGGEGMRGGKELTGKQRQLLERIRKEPGITQKRLVELTGLNQKTVSYNLNRLIRLRLVWKVKNEGKIGYEFITEEALSKEMVNRLMKKVLDGEVDQDTFISLMKIMEKYVP